MKSEHINELADALSKAQLEIGVAVKEKLNPFYKSKYADLEAVVEAARPALSKNGLSVTQLVNGPNLVTMLLHKSGQWLSSECPLVTKDSSPHAFVGAITYLRRATFAAIVGVVQADDDGNTAAGLTKENEAEKKSVPMSTQKRWNDAVAHGSKLGVSKARILAKLNVKEEPEITDTHLLNLKEYFSLVKDAKSASEVFPIPNMANGAKK